MPLSWSDQYKVGHPVIDSQHRSLFASVGRLVSVMSRQGQILCAKALYDEVREHFSFEERLMAEISYAEAEKHIGHHRHLLSKLDDLTHEIADRSFNMANLQSHITEWLVNHIVTSDAELAAHLHMAAHGIRPASQSCQATS